MSEMDYIVLYEQIWNFPIHEFLYNEFRESDMRATIGWSFIARISGICLVAQKFERIAVLYITLP